MEISMPMRPCWVEISAQALEDNYRFLDGLAAGSAELLAVVKSDAYWLSNRSNSITAFAH